jgi:hypothetical protein
MNINDDWSSFLEQINQHDDNLDDNYEFYLKNLNLEKQLLGSSQCPLESNFTPLYISTKTKMAYFKLTNHQYIDIYTIFWSTPILPYFQPNEGFLKKQIKLNCLDRKQSFELDEKLQSHRNNRMMDEHIVGQIDNSRNIKKPIYKDVRIISFGMCKKNILLNKIKKKKAFYNCVVLICRMKIENAFREFHVKLFNTGKIEFPGIKCDKMTNIVIDKFIELLQPYVPFPLKVDKSKIETVLINSDFNCGFYIKRENLLTILTSKYNMPCIYDSCTYPGIKCKLFLKEENNNNNTTIKINYMIFRTGSVLIVGKCKENNIYHAYDVIKNILQTEMNHIHQTQITEKEGKKKPKIPRSLKRKRQIEVNI